MGLLSAASAALAVAPSGAFERHTAGGRPVETSPDLERVLALPRRVRPSEARQTEMAAALTHALQRHPARDAAGHPCGCPIHTLLPMQGWYLHEAAEANGALGLLAVGTGKTGIGLLLPMVIPGVHTAVLLVPPRLRAQLWHDYAVWRRHFYVPNLAGGDTFVVGMPTLHVLAYSELSHERCARWLEEVQPDLVIADEAQSIADRGSVRTNRLLRYFSAREQQGRPVRLAAHSGSLTSNSITQYAHHAALSLREGSPMPLLPHEVQSWATVLDPVLGGAPAPMGALARLTAPGEHVREGFRRRLSDTIGVITTHDAQVPVPLRLGVRTPPPMPEALAATIAEVRDSATRPDGETLTEAVEVTGCLRQLACGFFYRWIYPRGESPELVERWFAARSAWFSELRRRLEGDREDLLDSPKLLRLAAERARAGYRGEAPTWSSAAWPAWEAVRDAVQPETATTWLSDWLVQDAVAWGREAPGIIWYGFRAFGAALAAAGDFPLFGEGDEASARLVQEDGTRTIVASIRAHGTGKNMPAWSRNLVTTPPADAGAWEQLLGRTHRRGQKKAVEVWRYAHVPELQSAFVSAQEKARYVQATTGNVQKLLYAESLTPYPQAMR